MILYYKYLTTDFLMRLSLIYNSVNNGDFAYFFDANVR